jgi:hypothetical protein
MGKDKTLDPKNIKGLIDLTGKKFGRLTVIDISYEKRCRYYWKCICDCGKETIVNGYSIKKGLATSCGCYRKELFMSYNKLDTTTHGMTNTKIYNVWATMLARCFNQNNKAYIHYGGRGIVVCDRWLHFECFYEDMGISYKNGLTLERNDVNDGYNKNNCCWETYKVQANNRRNSKRYEYNGNNMTIAEIGEKYNIKPTLISSRMNRGWNLIQSIETPIIPHGFRLNHL